MWLESHMHVHYLRTDTYSRDTAKPLLAQRTRIGILLNVKGVKTLYNSTLLTFDHSKIQV